MKVVFTLNAIGFLLNSVHIYPKEIVESTKAPKTYYLSLRKVLDLMRGTE